MTRAHALVPAAGAGDRARRDGNKVLAAIGGIPMVARTLIALDRCSAIEAITVVARGGEESRIASLCQEWQVGKLHGVVTGGAARSDSVWLGLSAMPGDVGIVAIHDAARPFVTPAIISRAVDLAAEHGAAVPAVPVIDTVKLSAGGERVERTLPRHTLWAVQTPQTFRADLIRRAHAEAQRLGAELTDDASAVELLGEPVCLFPGDPENLKITTPLDFEMAEVIARRRDGVEAPWLRTGLGYDAHRIDSTRPLVLGGVPIDSPFGLLGHSDADVLTHAIMDALLGAVSAGDIGSHFPDTDPAYQGARSLDLLRRVVQVVSERGYAVSSVDATVVAQAPRLGPSVGAMRAALAEALGIGEDCVSIKATTTEGMGFEGRGEGISAQAVASVRRCT